MIGWCAPDVISLVPSSLMLLVDSDWFTLKVDVGSFTLPPSLCPSSSPLLDAMVPLCPTATSTSLSNTTMSRGRKASYPLLVFQMPCTAAVISENTSRKGQQQILSLVATAAPLLSETLAGNVPSEGGRERGREGEGRYECVWNLPLPSLPPSPSTSQGS